MKNLLPVDGEVYLDEGWLASGEAAALLDRLVDELDWQQEHARFGAKIMPLPRLTAWYGDVGYRYSGVDHPPRPWPPVLADLRERLPRALGSADGQPAPHPKYSVDDGEGFVPTPDY